MAKWPINWHREGTSKATPKCIDLPSSSPRSSGSTTKTSLSGHPLTTSFVSVKTRLGLAVWSPDKLLFPRRTDSLLLIWRKVGCWVSGWRWGGANQGKPHAVLCLSWQQTFTKRKNTKRGASGPKTRIYRSGTTHFQFSLWADSVPTVIWLLNTPQVD